MLSNSGDAEPGAGKLELSQNILSFKLGPEFTLGLPALPVKPYLGLNLSYNTFKGEVKFQGTSKVSSGTFTIQSASRLGFGVNAGVLYKLNPLLTLDIGVEYALLNPFAKAWEDPNPARDDRIDSYLALNDEKDPLIQLGGDRHFISAARSISTIALNVAVLFGL
jgi:opacity protein-like surface antigen